MPKREKLRRGQYRFYRQEGERLVSVWGPEGFMEEIYTDRPLDEVARNYQPPKYPDKKKKRRGILHYILWSLGMKDD